MCAINKILCVSVIFSLFRQFQKKIKKLTLVNPQFETFSGTYDFRSMHTGTSIVFRLYPQEK